MSRIRLFTLSCLFLAVSSGWAVEAVVIDDPKEMVATEILLQQVAATNDRPKKTGGGSSSIGTDSYDLRTKTTWFYGTRQIVTCYNRLASFSLSDRQAEKVIRSSIANWKSYLKDKRISSSSEDESPNANFQFNGICKGGEDLVVFLGSGPIFGGLQDLKAVQKLSFPLAYVNKTRMSRDFKWSAGYIRIVNDGYYGIQDGQPMPNWKRPNALEVVLTHELGHVLGFDHVSGTIMRAEIYDQLTGSPKLDIKIDGERQLVVCSECAETFQLQVDVADEEFFKKIDFDIKSKKIEITRSDKAYELSNGKKSLSIQVNDRVELTSLTSLNSNFMSVQNGSTSTYNLYGIVETDRGKIPVVLEYNSLPSNGAIVLRASGVRGTREVGRFVRR